MIDAHPRNPSLNMGVSVSSIVVGPASSYLKSTPLSNKVGSFTQIFPVDIAAGTEQEDSMLRRQICIISKHRITYSGRTTRQERWLMIKERQELRAEVRES
jgi:hypothetical protein